MAEFISKRQPSIIPVCHCGISRNWTENENFKLIETKLIKHQNDPLGKYQIRTQTALIFFIFFCDASKQNEELDLFQTLYLDMRTKKIAHEINIDKLLHKLSFGDMVAAEAKYHRTSLIKFGNSYWNHNNDKWEQANEQLIKGITFSKVLEFIEESILACDETTTPVFYLKELTEMYKKHPIAQGATETASSVNWTRLKNAVLENVLGLYATKNMFYLL